MEAYRPTISFSVMNCRILSGSKTIFLTLDQIYCCILQTLLAPMAARL